VSTLKRWWRWESTGMAENLQLRMLERIGRFSALYHAFTPLQTAIN
jgi:hypothetical protein